MELENGYNTIVGDAGSHLSGGERQRISIARAMMKDSKIVILDEATAYTDPENEAVIQKSLSEFNYARSFNKKKKLTKKVTKQATKQAKKIPS